MDFTKNFVGSVLGTGSLGSDDAHIRTLGNRIGILDQMMLEAPAFLSSAGAAEGDERFRGYVVLLWLHCMAIRDTLLIDRGDGKRMWNAPALSVHGRALQDCFTGLFYFCIEKVDKEERELRDGLWWRHVLYKRSQLNTNLAEELRTPEITRRLAEEGQQLKAVEASIAKSPKLKAIERVNKGIASAIVKTRDRLFAEDQGAVWARAGFDKKQFGPTWMYLSQNVHSTPLAIYNVLKFRAETADASAAVTLPVVLAIWTFSKAVAAAIEANPTQQPYGQRIVALANDPLFEPVA
jgi:hypothetical protein